MTTESPELKALLKSLEHPDLKAIDLSLARIEQHLAAIGNPERKIPPVIHVAGTNGKGSTMAFLRAMFEAASYRCHVFTSPHLVHFRERITVAGQMLDESQIIEMLSQIKERMQHYPLTFFEANTVAAFEAFAQTKADIMLLEVGMGGRFDATNVLEKPALCIITPISMDHEGFLGNTLAKIAYEKAGIIKQGVPIIVAPQAPEAMEVIEKVAHEKSAPLMKVSLEIFETLSLTGVHQNINASVAKGAAHYIAEHGYEKLTAETINQGLGSAKWTGRLQKLSEGELVSLLPESTEIWIDGGHNEAAAQMLADWAKRQAKPVHLICAMSNQKDADAFLRHLAPAVESITVTEIPDEPLSMPPEKLLQAAQKHHKNTCQSSRLADSLVAIPHNAIALMAGSLYLVGSILEKNR